MKRFRAKIKSIAKLGDGYLTCRLACPTAAIPAAGQAILALNETNDDKLRHTLFPLQILGDGFRSLIPTGERWLPGDRLDLLGPLGFGFQPPQASRRWLLMTHQCDPQMLMSLVDAAVSRQASVCFVSDRPPNHLPVDVEILPEAETGFEWAEYAAIGLPAASLSGIKDTFGRFADFPLPCPTEVLLTDELVCGFGGCLSCGLATREGWALRCRQGPVISWDRLRV